MQNLALAPPSRTSHAAVSSRRRARDAAAAPGCGCAATAQGAQSAALAALGTLASSCSTAQSVVSNNPLGRYADNGSCTYDCGFKEQDWNWWADYRFVNANLQTCVGQMNFSQPYGTAFQPTQGWVAGNLPGIASSLQAALLDIRQVDAAIGAAHGEETPAQAAQLAADFGTLAQGLVRNEGLMGQALQQLASFIGFEQGQGGALDSLAASSQSYIHTDATNTENNLTGQIACGAGDVQNSFNNMFADIATKFTAMQASFSSVDANFLSALNAVQAVAGVFLVLQQDNDLVGQRFTMAQGLSPTDPLRALDLDIAGNVWSGLVDMADTQFQGAV